MQRIAVDNDAYLIADPPQGATAEEVEAAVRAAVGKARPQVVVWDAEVRSRDGRARLRFGDGGLDDLLLAQVDMSGCCAVLESAHRRLKAGGGAPSALSLAQLARAPHIAVARAEGLSGQIDLERPTPGARKVRPAGHPDMISAIVVAHGDAGGVETFIEAFLAQKLTSRAEILVVAAGLGREEARALSETLDALESRTLARPMRIRHFILPGKMGETTVVNTGLSLATGQVAVVARPDCIPESADTIQTLANWAAGGDVFTVSPRITDGEHRLLAAGLYAETAGGDGVTLRPWTDRTLCEVVRRVAAPAPWFFAVNRAAWLDQGGAAGPAEGLWTAGLARTGKHLLAGSAGVIWTGERRPAAAQKRGLAASLSSDSARAMTWAAAPLAPSVAKAPAARLEKSAAVRPPALVEAGAPAAFSDPFPSRAPMRLLVFADGFGASQALAFVDGLAQARAQGQAAVRIVEERALGRDGFGGEPERLGAIDQHFAETAPTAVVLSRFGHDAASRLIVAAARARGAAVVMHLDDDLFDLPPILGVERYRVARDPRRLQALHRVVREADLVIATNPVLAGKLSRLGAAGRVGWLDIGTAGRPRPRSPAKPADEALVIGYMGSASHNHDLEMIAPALNAVLERFDHVSVELFGSIAEQSAGELLRGRVRKRPPVTGDYQGFKAVLAGLDWDIGLAPLRPIAYNRFKTPTKWVEYAEAGIATIVSDSEVYQPMIQAEAALSAGPQQWESAIGRLIEQPEVRDGLVAAADRLLRSSYGWERLEAGMLGLLRRVGRATLAA